MGFVLDGLDSEDYDRSYTDRELLKRILDYFSPHRRRIALAAGTLVLFSLFGIAMPIVIARTLDIARNAASTPVLLLLAGTVFLLGAASWGFNYLRQKTTATVVGDVVLELRERVFTAAVNHDLSFYDEHPSGKIVSRITSDTQDFSDIVTLVMDVLGQFFMVLLLTGWLLFVDVRLTCLLMAMAPLAVAIALSFRRIARKVTRRARRATAMINAQIQESISGITVAKSFRQEQTTYDAFDASNRRAYRVGVQRGLVLDAIFPVMTLAAGLGNAALVYAGGWGVHGGRLSPGDWFLFMQSVAYFWWPLISIASFWSQFQDGLAAAERVFALVDAEPRVHQTDRRVLPRLQGSIVFDGLGFGYAPGRPVLSDFHLTVPPGETVALVGRTGAGKSSIARLVTRFYEFQHGRLLIDGHDIRTLDLSHYRRRVGFVPQDPFLFGGTVADNIAYSTPGARREAVLAAAMQIGGGDWLKDLAAGLDTEVGARGANLSMGQRQLVALARILLKDPAIFILDEATASVDPFTEAQIQEGLETIMRDRTALVIAHRLSTVRHADRILVIDAGRIVESGDHASLLTAGGTYADLYNTYFRHQSLEYIERSKPVDTRRAPLDRAEAAGGACRARSAQHAPGARLDPSASRR